MSARDPVDFSHVDRRHAAVHERLEAWGRWCAADGRPRGGSQPMFRSTGENIRETAPSEAVDIVAVMAVERLMKDIPERNRGALKWAYVAPWLSVRRVCESLRVDREGLMQAIVEGRDRVAEALHL